MTPRWPAGGRFGRARDLPASAIVRAPRALADLQTTLRAKLADADVTRSRGIVTLSERYTGKLLEIERQARARADAAAAELARAEAQAGGADTGRGLILPGFIGQPSADQRQFLAVVRAQMFAGFKIKLCEPVIGDVATPGMAIFGNVAGDIGELESHSKIAGAVECFAVIG